MKKYIALIIFEIRNLTNNQFSYSESTILLEATGDDNAYEKARAFISESEISYKNGFGEELNISLYKIVDLKEFLFENPDKNGVLEVYARYFSDIDAYLKFDSLGFKN